MKGLMKKALPLMVPEQYIVWRRNDGDNTTYLTFDDGPSPEYTPQVLDILSELGAKATFFLVGKKARANEDLVREIVARGHRIGNHTYSHRTLPQMTPRDFAAEFDRTKGLLREISGDAVTMFRPPKGLLSAGALSYLLRYRFQIVLWSIDSCDYHRDSLETVLKAMDATSPRRGDIILLHDDNPFTIKALPSIVERIHRAGLAAGRL